MKLKLPPMDDPAVQPDSNTQEIPPVRVVFMGTPDFACGPLRALINTSVAETVLVVSQPDKAKGRKQVMEATPVKRLAVEAGIPVEQPYKLKDGCLEARIRELEPDLIITCAYGRILPESILRIPRLGSFNIHASLLPQYRGASPMQWSLINGDKVSGVTIIKMDAEMDHGPIYAQSRFPIADDLDLPRLSRFLSRLGAELLTEFLPQIAADNLEPQEQAHDKATYVSMLSRENGRVRWSDQARQIYNLWRGTLPWPGIFTYYKGRKIKLLKVKPLETNSTIEWLEHSANLIGEEGQAGSLLKCRDKGRLFVLCGNGSVLEILELQPEGAKALLARDCAHNYHEGELFMSEVQADA